MKTRNLGIVLNQGADFSLVIRIVGDGGALDITGYEFLSQMRKTTAVEDPVEDPIAEFSFEILDQVTNKGQVRWYLEEADSAAIVTSIATALTPIRETTPFVYDVKMKDTLDVVSRIIQGIVYVSPQSTQEDFT